VGPEPALLARLERAVCNFRLQAAHNLLDVVLSSYAPEVVMRDVIAPLLEHLERDGREAAARFAASLLEVRLLAQGRGWDAIDGPSAVLACAPGEDRVLGLIALGLALADRRCRVVYLGAAVDPAEVRRAALVQKARLVVLSAETADMQPREQCELVCARRVAPILVMGAACHDVAAAIGGTALPADPVAACAEVARLVGERHPPGVTRRHPPADEIEPGIP
jgi:hypothetical protein